MCIYFANLQIASSNFLKASKILCTSSDYFLSNSIDISTGTAATFFFEILLAFAPAVGCKLLHILVCVTCGHVHDEALITPPLAAHVCRGLVVPATGSNFMHSASYPDAALQAAETRHVHRSKTHTSMNIIMYIDFSIVPQ